MILSPFGRSFEIIIMYSTHDFRCGSIYFLKQYCWRQQEFRLILVVFQISRTMKWVNGMNKTNLKVEIKGFSIFQHAFSILTKYLHYISSTPTISLKDICFFFFYFHLQSSWHVVECRMEWLNECKWNVFDSNWNITNEKKGEIIKRRRRRRKRREKYNSCANCKRRMRWNYLNCDALQLAMLISDHIVRMKFKYVIQFLW